ncbi:TIGR03620 family F420-dependent LLM class oxidoreductase [Cumulibacter manganitolerans]|uniref:TIGR03620 family F420-dependent LLM class oxidoreductase n=1 Tax=Cumulibacter manganitolerans TaxID=1884992 RepID=UPI00129811A4|nr:TIGR03620 family F420-dependent LLM class oxidoreductase [Cumulibacter manganitolerans]
MALPDIGKIGVWLRADAATASAARTAERLGYGAVWIGGSPSGDLEHVRELLAATSIPIATGIINVWASPAEQTAQAFLALPDAYRERTILGVGIGHREATAEYRSPFATLEKYVDDLLAAGVPRSHVVLAALGPRVMRLAGERTAGAHPYFTTPAHTAQAREILGAGPLLAPEQKVLLNSDPDEARRIARPTAKRYFGLRNYAAMLKRLGFTDADLAGEGSDRAVDAAVAHGDVHRVAAVVRAHLDAGADHVCIQPLGDLEAELTALADVLPVATRG